MAKYTFNLKFKHHNYEYKYSLDLQPYQENMPEQIFNLKLREEIRQELQKQISCRINDINLNCMIKTWIQDIKEGYRDSSITIELPVLIQSNINNCNKTATRELLALINPDISDVEPMTGALPPLSFC